MHTAGGGSPNQQRDFAHAEIVVLLHFASDKLHFFQTRRNQATQTNDIGAFHLGFGQNFMARHHHTHVDHIEVITLQHHGHDVFANVVHIALHGGNHDLTFGLHIHASGFLLAFFFLDIRH